MGRHRGRDIARFRTLYGRRQHIDQKEMINTMDAFKNRCLIAYFSREGNNYVGGKIVNWAVGNTKVAASIIQKTAGGDLFRIESTSQYPEDYNEATDVAGAELRANSRPKLSSQLERIAAYDVIFLGYPNWWGTMPIQVTGP